MKQTIGIQIAKEKVKISLFENDVILYIKDSTRKLPQPIYTVNKVAGLDPKISIQKSVYFLYTNNKHSEEEIRSKNHSQYSQQ